MITIYKMVKVALLLSGQPRFVDSISYKYIRQNILDQYDCDVFCHTWFDKNEIMSTAPWSALKEGFKCKGDELETIQKLYNPIVFTYDSPLNESQIHIQDDKRNNNLKNMYSMYTSMQRCFSNFYGHVISNKNICKYDVYIRCRYDVIPTVLPNFNLLQQNTTYFVDHHGNAPILANNLVISTSFEAFSILMNILNYFDDFVLEANNSDEHNVFKLVQMYQIPHIKIPRQFFKDILPQELTKDDMYNFNKHF
jgi:hypothetical protein